MLLAPAIVPALASSPAAGSTYTIRPDGSGDYATIQAAVDAAGPGDIIELVNGTYTGDGNRDIVVPAVDLTIRSEGGVVEDCTIDCGGSARSVHRGFYFASSGAGSATLQGIGVINGYVSADGGGGIWVAGSSPTITDCAVGFCTATGSSAKGGGLYVSDGGAPAVTGCYFVLNVADYGGGVAFWASEGTLEDCEIADNEALLIGGGVYGQFSGTATLTRCTIVSNAAPSAGGIRMGAGLPELIDCEISRNDATMLYAGGVWLQAGSLIGCTIVDNHATTWGGGVYCQAGTGELVNCLVAYSTYGYGIAAYAAEDAPSLTCCDVYGNTNGNYHTFAGDPTGTGGNISQDPRMCNYEGEEYSLDFDSPCLPGGNACEVRIGAYGQGCDTPVREASWGSIKGMFR
jgi:hypothetical protein